MIMYSMIMYSHVLPKPYIPSFVWFADVWASFDDFLGTLILRIGVGGGRGHIFALFVGEAGHFCIDYQLVKDEKWRRTDPLTDVKGLICRCTLRLGSTYNIVE